MTLVLRAGSATDPGRVRPVNQDRVLILDGRMFVVADGMGGHRGGEVAAQLTIEELPRAVAMPRGSESATLSSDEFVAAIERANQHVLNVAESDPDLHGMGTTITALAPVSSASGDTLLAVFNVGDSRTYWLRDGELTQLTDDHNMVAELVRDGRLTVDEARHHRQRSVLTRALGVEPDIDVDVIEILAARGDRYVLCSDGLYSEVPDEVIGSVLRRIADPAEAAQELVRVAVQQGGRDNVSVVVVDVIDDGDAAAHASSALEADSTARPVDQPPDDPNATTGPTGPTLAVPKKKGPRRPWPVNLRVLIFLAVLAALGGAVAWTIRNAPAPDAPQTSTTLDFPTITTPEAAPIPAPVTSPVVTVAPDPFGPTTKPVPTTKARPTTRGSGTRTPTTTAPKS